MLNIHIKVSKVNKITGGFYFNILESKSFIELFKTEEKKKSMKIDYVKNSLNITVHWK